MAKTHLLGNARIGEKRQLKFALEQYWNGDITPEQLQQTADGIQLNNNRLTETLDFTQVGDFSFYDHVLDTSFLLGNVPARAKNSNDSELNNYFRVARGKADNHSECCNHAGEMTKWFDTNYHYIVPEFDQTIEFQLNPKLLLKQIHQAKQTGALVKPVILGPVTYLFLGKSKGNGDKLALLDKLIPVYQTLFETLQRHGIEWVQIDEPALVLDLEPQWQLAYRYVYNVFKNQDMKLLLTTYFGELKENLKLAAELPVAGIHIDVINTLNHEKTDEATYLANRLTTNQVLSLGVINGRNIWKSDLTKILDYLEPLHHLKGNNLWLAPSCSLLHVPIDLELEIQLPEEIKNWLAFGKQKITELELLKTALNQGRRSVKAQLLENASHIASRQSSPLVNHKPTQEAVSKVNLANLQRASGHNLRQKKQQALLKLPAFPTTTIGSFPQTQEIRQVRSQFKQGKISQVEYTARMQQDIQQTIEYQHSVGLDVLVHGEPERNDMVEYFGELLEGFAQTQFGWVQSYGSRCVKPPIIFGDIYRSQPLTVQWATYAQSLSEQPVKGMLTGPVTILNWSFVRDDQTREQTCLQIALAIKEEVLELEKNNIHIIQIDEAALREGLPLRKADWQSYLDWAISAFKLCVKDVADTTQIHTHMCYSEFDDIITAIADMDADVITIECARSDDELLETFKDFEYPNQIGPGVYDIHSPNVPSIKNMRKLIENASQLLSKEQLWVNPDCGLKTRKWPEVKLALNNMVEAARQLREQ